MDTNIIRLESLRERDIDLLILEEWSVNPLFSQWVLGEFFDITTYYKNFDGWHSVVSSGLGESDLLLTAENQCSKIAILMENKIDASARDNQANRYSKRAEKIQKEYQFSQVFTCIVAPEHYLENDEEAKSYDIEISYEKLSEWFAIHGDIRSKYRANILNLAISKERRRPRPVKHEGVTEFWQNYYRALMKTLPDARMDEPKSIPEASDWPMIKFRHFPKYWRIIHKLAQGCLDIEVSWTSEKTQEYVNQLACNKIVVAKPGKRTVMRINVAPVNRHQDFLEQKEAIDLAFEDIRLLRDKTKQFPPDESMW